MPGKQKYKYCYHHNCLRKYRVTDNSICVYLYFCIFVHCESGGKCFANTSTMFAQRIVFLRWGEQPHQQMHPVVPKTPKHISDNADFVHFCNCELQSTAIQNALNSTENTCSVNFRALCTHLLPIWTQQSPSNDQLWKENVLIELRLLWWKIKVYLRK